MADPSGGRFSRRMLAPLSLAGFALAFLIVIVASVGNGSDTERPDRSGRPASNAPPAATPKQTTAPGAERVYVVRAGDTLSKIATRTAVPVERLLALNPTIDPQALVSGQRIKLRE